MRAGVTGHPELCDRWLGSCVSLIRFAEARLIRVANPRLSSIQLSMSRSSELLRPPKLYLDTAHLINIGKRRCGEPLPAAVRDAYAYLDECIRVRHLGLIYSQPAALDWVDGDATLESAYQIADVLDSAKLRYFFEGDSFIYLHELLTECRRAEPSLKVPAVPILQVMENAGVIETALGTLLHEIPGYNEPGDLPKYVTDPSQFPRNIPVITARRGVKETFRYKRENPETYQEREDGYIAALSQDIERRTERDISVSDLVSWAKRFLRIDRVLNHKNENIEVDQLLGRLDLENCPGTKLWFAARSKRIDAGHPGRENDVDDWVFLPIVPYCDITLTDRAFREFILQGDRSLTDKVFADPRQAVIAIERLWET